MRHIDLVIDDKDAAYYEIENDVLTFDELRRKIIGNLGRKALVKSAAVAESVGLTAMTDEEIEKEIRAVRSKK